MDRHFDRRDFLRTLAAGAAFSIARRGFGQTPPDPIATNKLTDRIAMVSGDGGNVEKREFGHGCFLLLIVVQTKSRSHDLKNGEPLFAATRGKPWAR